MKGRGKLFFHGKEPKGAEKSGEQAIGAGDSERKAVRIIILLAGLLTALFVASFLIGRYTVTVLDVLRIFGEKFFHIQANLPEMAFSVVCKSCCWWMTLPEPFLPQNSLWGY